jgi:predicted nucleotide-binding protein (sugar kinase/HSP70/actin superfamily)
MDAPETIKAGFLKEKDIFAENGIRYVASRVSFGEPLLVPRQLYESLRHVIEGLTLDETKSAVHEGYRTLGAFNQEMRAQP